MAEKAKDTKPRQTRNKPAAAPAQAPASERPHEEAEPELYDRVQQRAYQIWESEGRPDGREEEHWQRAEREILQEIGGTSSGATRSKRRTTTSRT